MRYRRAKQVVEGRIRQRLTCLQDSKATPFLISTLGSSLRTSAMKASNSGCGTLWIICIDRRIQISTVHATGDPAVSQALYLWCIVEDTGVHSLVRQDPYPLSAQIRQEVHPVSIFTRCPNFTESLGVESELPAKLKTPGADCVCFRSSQPLRVLLNDETSD